MKLSVVISTLGRPELDDVLLALHHQRADEVIVVFDGPSLGVTTGGPYAHRMLDTARVIRIPERVMDYGCTPKDVGADLATGDAVWFFDDDDIVAPGAVKAIKRGVSKAPAMAHCFRIVHQGLGIILGQNLQVARVGAPCVVVPNDRIPSWRDQLAHSRLTPDWFWIQACADKYGMFFHPDLIGRIERQRFGSAT